MIASVHAHTFRFSRKGEHAGAIPVREGRAALRPQCSVFVADFEITINLFWVFSWPLLAPHSRLLRLNEGSPANHAARLLHRFLALLPRSAHCRLWKSATGASRGLPTGSACRQRTLPRVRHLDSPRAEHPLTHSCRQRGVRGCRGQQWITPGTRDHAACRRDPGPNPNPAFNLNAYWKVRSEPPLWSVQLRPIALSGRDADLSACDCVLQACRWRRVFQLGPLTIPLTRCRYGCCVCGGSGSTLPPPTVVPSSPFLRPRLADPGACACVPVSYARACMC